MKKKIILIACIIAALIIAIAFFINDTPTYEGQREKNPESYILKFEKMNGEDHHYLDMTRGKAIAVHLEKISGSFSLVIGIDGAEPIYKSDNVESGDFDLPITQPGRYRVVIKAKHAKGAAAFHIKQMLK